MTMLAQLAVLEVALQVLAITATVVLVAWFVGGALLRFLGGGAVLTSLLLVGLGHPLGLAGVALGTVAWASGHWIYALRHHAYKSPLARRLFLQVLPARLDPTRRWATPTTSTTNDL